MKQVLQYVIIGCTLPRAISDNVKKVGKRGNRGSDAKIDDGRLHSKPRESEKAYTHRAENNVIYCAR